MSRVRVSTTVDGELLRAARAAVGGATDSYVLETALKALLWSYRSAAVDSAYETAYAVAPLTTSDDCGDLESWRNDAGSVSPVLARRGQAR